VECKAYSVTCGQMEEGSNQQKQNKFQELQQQLKANFFSIMIELLKEKTTSNR